MKTISSLISLIVTAIFSIAAAAQDYEVPRTQWGQPDLQGVWNWSSNVPMQRPARVGDRQFLTAEEVEEAARRRAAADANSDAALPIEGVDGSYNDFWFDRGNDGFVIDGQYRTSILTYPENGRMPSRTSEGQLKADAAPKFAWPERDGAWWLETGDQPYDGPENQTLAVRCIYHQPATIPITPRVYNNLKTIVQTDEYFMLYIEWMHWARIIRIDDEHHSEALATFDGDSVGRWEGDTLVVETVNFMDQPYQPAQRRVIERFSPEPEGGLIYSFTVEDADYSDTYSGEMVWPKSEQVPYEYACHEGNYAMSATLMGARVREAEHRAANGSDD